MKALWRAPGRLLPHTMRARLSLSYAALFLVAGAALLGLTYGLVAHSLPRPSPTVRLDRAQQAKLVASCKQENLLARGLGKSGKAAAVPTDTACAKAFAAGASATAADQRSRTLRDLLVYSLLGLGVMTVASGGIGWWMAGRAVRPLRAITGAARRASEENLSERISLAGPDDELKELADTFDDMLDRLDAGVSRQRRFIADASHELRTPLTVMRTAIDVTMAKPSRSPEQLEAMAAKLRRSVEHSERLVEALLTLATSQRASGDLEPVDLATAAEDVLDTAAGEIDRLGLRLETELGPAPVVGHRVLIERLVSNLVDNAVRHNRPGGWLHVRTAVEDGVSLVEVANTGPVVPAHEVDSLFEAFHRRERTAGEGVGLGLAIVASVASAHHAELAAAARPDGGLVVTVRFGAPPP